MKKSHILWPVLVASSTLAVTGSKPARDSFMDHLTFSGRFGFNVKAKIGPRVTSDGALYNYVDGYVHTDSTGNFDPLGTLPGGNGTTSYWGYDNSTRQAGVLPVDGYPTIAMTRSAAGSDFTSHAFDDNPRLGMELSYTRELGHRGKWRYGFEVAINYMNLCLRDNAGFNGNGIQDYFPYYPLPANNFPPAAGTAASPDPFQGTFGPGNNYLLIGGAPIGSATVPVSITGRHRFDADIWGLRVGPYLSHPLGKHAEINLVGGFAAVLVNASASWSETATINGVQDTPHSGSGSGCDVLWGYYVGANISWHLSKRWDVNAGVQFQDVGMYRKNLGSRAAELDLSESIFVTVGVSYKF